MKNFLLLLLFSLLSFVATSQVVTGVYKGKMVSDSLSYAVDFELTLKEKNGELYGYCQRLFLVNDVLYYNLVKVKARIKDSVLIVEDEKSVSNNFEEKRRGIKTVYMFKIKDIVDTARVLQGDWATSASRNLYAMPGKLVLNRERNYLSTQLYKRLEEKKLAKEMQFEEPATTQPAMVSAPKKPETKPSTITNEPTKTDVVAGSPKQEPNQQVVSNMPKPTTMLKDSTQQPSANPKGNQPQGNPTNTNTASNQPKQSTSTQGNTKPPVTSASTATPKDTLQTVVQKTDVAITPPPQVNKQQAGTSANTGNKPSSVPNQQTNTQKPTTETNQPKQPIVSKPVTTQPQQSTTNPVTTDSKPVPNVVPPPQTETSISAVGQTTKDKNSNQPLPTGKPPIINNPTITKRTTEIIDALEISGDSVILSLYDNGEIDGDTVSIFLNNELLLAKVGLRANAYKHTIALQPGEAVQLTLFAENLGSIPPNTGLLVVTTNDQRYQVHFTSTLNKSSSIVIRRKE
jgi:hypothetical protein